MRTIRLALSILAIALPAIASAQGTDAVIDGRVVSTGARGVVEATVTIRNTATGFVTSTRSSPSGHFLFAQLPLGGSYELTVHRLGFAPFARSGITLSLGARVRVVAELVPSATPLAAVIVRDDSALIARQRLGGSTRLDATILEQVPTLGRNFIDLASLAPTVGADLSIGGARPTSTDVRIDGLQARNMLRGGELGRGPYTLSMEAIREFEIVTNLFDVSQGRQGGGAISAVTKSGTNTAAGSLFAYHRDDALSASQDYLGRGRELRRLNVWQVGGSAGGPIARDRLHYFLAFDRQQSSVPLAIADVRTSQDEIIAQVNTDSLARFVDILQRKYGEPARPVGVFSRTSVANSVFSRLDWHLNEHHHITLRNNFTNSDSPNDGVGDQLLAVIESRSGSRSVDNQTLLSLRSSIGPAVQNELKFGFSLADRSLTPNSYLPRGFVRVRSALPDGTTGDVMLQFGGNRLAPERSGERQYQLANTAYWSAGDALITFGFDNSLTFLRTFIPTDEGGLFAFDSLGALENLKSSKYTRQVPYGAQPSSQQWVFDGGLFAQAEWRPGAHLVATTGLRWDVTSFRTAAGANPLVTQKFGLHTDNAPTDWTKLQPRAQLTWDPRDDGRDVVRIGVGSFAAQPHYYLQANNIFFNGTQLADLTLSGAKVPTPNFPAYRAALSTVPGVPAGTSAPSYVNLMSDSFRDPVTWKVSATWSHRVLSGLTLSGTLLGSETYQNYQYFDRNLGASAFSLDNEGGRPVFVPANTISAAGKTAAANAFLHPEFTHVLELVSTGRSHERTAIVEGLWALPRGASVRASYTWNDARDNSTFSCCIARTASLFTPVKGDPRNLSGSWGPSDYDFRNKLTAVVEVPLAHGTTLSARYVGSTGRPFSLVVNGDINGDDYSGNDLAFVFDPNDPATPPDIAAAMRRVLANPRSIARSYIARNLGKIADRNGGFAPWSERVDVRIAKSFATLAGQRAEFIVDVYNFANMLNSGWGGQYLLPQGISASNPLSQQLTLLNIVGFDQATRRYKYTVNENVGVLAKRGDPYQIQVGIRYGF